MKCFNHPDQDAVATCQNCGKGLCRECAAKHTPCLCDSCVALIQREQQQEAQRQEDQRKQKYKAALVDTRDEFLKTAIIGVILAIFFAFIVWSDAGDFQEYTFAIGVGFCVPFGWKFLTYLQSFFPVTIFGTMLFWIIWCAVKFVLSFYLGVPALIYQIIKTVITQRKINSLK